MQADAYRVAVIDIGTNSTRLLIADVGGGRVTEVQRRSRVTRLGRGVDLSGQLSVEAIEALAGDLRGPIGEAAAEMPGSGPKTGIAVAGTPTSLAAIEIGLEPYDSERVHGHTLTLPAIQRLLSRLASVPLGERGEIPG